MFASMMTYPGCSVISIGFAGNLTKYLAGRDCRPAFVPPRRVPGHQYRQYADQRRNLCVRARHRSKADRSDDRSRRADDFRRTPFRAATRR